MADEERRPIGDVLSGLGIHPLDDGWTPVEAFVVIKANDADGDTVWAYRTTAPPNREELLGVLMVQTDLLRRELLADWEE